MIGRTLSISNQRFPWRARWAILLLAIAVGSAAYRIAEVAVGVDTVLTSTIVILAIGLGWLMAAGQTKGGSALAMSILAGIVVLTLRIGRIGPQLIAVPEELLRWLYESVRLQGNASAEPLAAAITELATDLGVLYSRLWLWLGTLATGQGGTDPVASAITWSALIWGAAVSAAWLVRRRNQPIAAVVPVLVILGISYVISRGPASAFVVPLGSTLLLMAFAGHDARARRWDKAGIDTPEGKTSSLAIIVVPIAILLTITAAWVQSLSIVRIVNVLDSIAGGRAWSERALADSLGLERGSASATGLEPLFAPGLPNSHLIGSGPELSEQIVMEISVTNLSMEDPAPGFRWRSISYDQYLGRGWRTSDLFLTDHAAGELIREPKEDRDQVIRQSVRGIADLGGRVYSAGLPATLDQQVQVAWRRVGEDAFAATAQTLSYQVESIVSRASQAELRAAGADYPDWVRKAYMALPGSVPARVLALARDLTATAATPYDRALAIETYLRAIPYNLDVTGPPLDRDVVDYFLFDLKEGYCDYYASSMVVLARAAGLPARLVVGYFTGAGQRSEGTFRYTVTEAEAHSWVEVYFPEIGWIEFEPTGGRSAIVRSDTTDRSAAPEAPTLQLAERSPLKIDVESPIISVLAGVAIVWASWVLLLDPLRLRRRPPRRALTTLYQRLRGHASHLDVGLLPGDTPAEFQAAIAKSRIGKLREETRGLIDTYARAAYTRRKASKSESSRLIRAWRGLSFRLWLERLKRTLRIP